MQVKQYSQFFSGFMQHAGRFNGVLRIWGEAYEQNASPHHVLSLDEWHVDIDHKAEAIWRLQPERVLIAGYSWGGWTAVRLAAELEVRQVKTDVLLLSDAVYRPNLKIAYPLSLYKGWKIEIPVSVSVLRAWRQSYNRPAGHELVVPDGIDFRETMLERIKHAKMDDISEFRDSCLFHAANASP